MSYPSTLIGVRSPHVSDGTNKVLSPILLTSGSGNEDGKKYQLLMQKAANLGIHDL